MNFWIAGYFDFFSLASFTKASENARSNLYTCIKGQATTSIEFFLVVLFSLRIFADYN